MTGNNKSPTPDDHYRRGFTLTVEQARELAGIAIPCMENSAAKQAKVNDFWLRMGQAHGFVWTTLRDLGGNIYDYEIDPITFTAEVEDVLPGPDNAEARAWMDRTFGDPCCSQPGGDPSQFLHGRVGALFTPGDVIKAFQAGRRAGLIAGVPLRDDDPVLDEVRALIAAGQGDKA